MKKLWWLAAGLSAALALSTQANAEILAMLNYESKPKEALKALKLPVTTPRQEGIAIIDVDPESPNFGSILMDIPLPPDLVAHHIFYNRDSSKAYVTTLGKPEMRVLDMRANPYRMKTVSVPDCMVGEDVVFSDDNKTWYLTCMGSAAVIVGDVATDEIKQVIKTPKPYPHGIAVHNGIDRMLISNTVRHTDLKDPGEEITEIEASSGKILNTYKVTDKPSPSGVAPVEILFKPGHNPPVAYITNMYGGTLSAAFWDPNKGKFAVREVYDFSQDKAGVPLEMYFSPRSERLYVTTAKPGRFHIFDTSGGPDKLKLLKTLEAGEGAHHVAFTQDWKYAFVQNALLNLPGMSDGSITVIDLEQEKVVASVDTFKKRG
nr:YncE family protein [Alphaproteobacteria bacterium]